MDNIQRNNSILRNSSGQNISERSRTSIVDAILDDEEEDDQAKLDIGMISDYKDLFNNEDPELLGNTHMFRAHPETPAHLWDTYDLHYLERVQCKCVVVLAQLNPKDGTFSGKMRCRWNFRTQNLHARTEPRVRVPGIRMPNLSTSVEESRVWRVVEADSKDSICWSGETVLTFGGYEIFEVHEFPFDRQLINMEPVQFVWRRSEDVGKHEESMKVVSLNIETTSRLPEWGAYHALLVPLDTKSQTNGPSYCCNFAIKLRMQRKPNHYITQIFLVSMLILCASLLPIGFSPDTATDRMALHAGGLLTIVAFKYSLYNDLPVVPYATYASSYLTLQIVTLVIVMLECLLSYKVTVAWALVDPYYVEKGELGLLIVFILAWIIHFVRTAFVKSFKPWNEVLKDQADGFNPSASDKDDEYKELTSVLDRIRNCFGSHRQQPLQAVLSERRISRQTD